MTRLAVWVQGARLRTLGASIAPVVVGTSAAGVLVAWRFVAADTPGAGDGASHAYAPIDWSYAAPPQPAAQPRRIWIDQRICSRAGMCAPPYDGWASRT